jgi:hypothetical protein
MWKDLEEKCPVFGSVILVLSKKGNLRVFMSEPVDS